MPTQDLLALAVFAFAASITPGPNNLMLLSSGLNFGLRRTLPHWLGVSGGLGAMLVATGLGLAAVLSWEPALLELLRWVGAAYLLLLAWRQWRATLPAARDAAAAQPLGFWAAFGFQALNPKVWLMAVTAVSAYASGGRELLPMSLLFCAVNFPCVGLWAWAGSRLRNWLSQGRRLQAFNTLMAGLLAASALPLLFK
jgi:threonine/homoserine/homoserine lactone efflux protein